MTKPFSLSKQERLKSKKDIDTLFLTGKAFFVFPFKVFYRLSEHEPTACPLLFGVTVPKRIFKRANKRNTIKRIVRELYRINKQQLKDHLIVNKKTLHVMFVYTHSEILSYHELSPFMLDVLRKMKKKLNDNPLNYTDSSLI